MRGSAPDIVLAHRSNPLQYAMMNRQQQARNQQLQIEDERKKREANTKAFMDLYKIDPGKPWEKFNDVVYKEVGDVRDWVASEQFKGSQANDPKFLKDYHDKVDRVKQVSDKTVYLKDLLGNLTDAVVKDPYRNDQYYIGKFLEKTQDANGNLIHPDKIDIDELEKIQFDMNGYDASLAAKDFVKTSPEDLVSWIEQNNSRYGGVMTSREELKSKLYQVEKLPDGSAKIKTDPMTGLPVMNITDEVIDGWKSNSDRALWLQGQMDQTRLNPYENPRGYKEAERLILEKELSPFAYAQRRPASASFAKNEIDRDYEGTGLTKQRFDNAMLFKKTIDDYQKGNLGLLEANPKVGKVERKDGKDYIYDKDVEVDEKGNIIGGTVIDVIDHGKPDGDAAKIYQWMPYSKKPTNDEMVLTPPYVPEDGSDPNFNVPLVKEPGFYDKAVIKEILNGNKISELINHQDNGKWIRSAEFSKGNIKIVTEDGKTRTIPANDYHYKDVEKILLSPKKGSEKKKTVTPPAQKEVKMPFNIN